MATTLIMTPMILTSCSSKDATGHAYDLSKFYYPNIERHVSGKYVDEEINEIYTKQLQENLDTFTQDYLWSKSWTGSSFNQYAFLKEILPKHVYIPSVAIDGSSSDLYKSDKEVISNLSMHLQHRSKTLTDPTLSFTLKFESNMLPNIMIRQYDEDATGYVNGHISGEIKFNNVPFHINNRVVNYIIGDGPEYETTSVLGFEPDIDFMLGTPSAHVLECEKWEIDFYVFASISGELTYNTGLVRRIACDYTFSEIAKPNQTYWPKHFKHFYDLTNLFTSSYYLQRIYSLSPAE